MGKLYLAANYVNISENSPTVRLRDSGHLQIVYQSDGIREVDSM